MLAAYYALHYGSDYLGWSIKSIYDHVDKIFVFYSRAPSYSHQGTLPNPDNKEKLVSSAFAFGDPRGKIAWMEGQWLNESAHRTHAVNHCIQEGADSIVVVDADEIWDDATFVAAMSEASSSNARYNRIRMLTLWRSFSWHCMDGMGAIRIIFPKRAGGDACVCQDPNSHRVFHFGYARDLASIRYKVSIHGHKGEWRPEWLGRYENWPSSGNEDLHPVAVNAWSAKPFDKTRLPEFLRAHPYYGLDVIK